MPLDNIVFETPAGNAARFLHRTATTDYNTVHSILVNDEYELPSGLTGWALDVGAHIGGATIALALDNPGMSVIAVEPLSENIELLGRNVALNGLSRYVLAVEAVVGADVVYWGWSATPSQIEHRYIGNLTGEAEDPQHEARPQRLTLRDLVGIAGGHVAFMKTDCEGGEWEMLADPAIAHVDAIAGEWHAVNGHTGEDVVTLLARTHDVTFTTGIGGGGFRAVRRG